MLFSICLLKDVWPELVCQSSAEGKVVAAIVLHYLIINDDDVFFAIIVEFNAKCAALFPFIIYFKDKLVADVVIVQYGHC